MSRRDCSRLAGRARDGARHRRLVTSQRRPQWWRPACIRPSARCPAGRTAPGSEACRRVSTARLVCGPRMGRDRQSCRVAVRGGSDVSMRSPNDLQAVSPSAGAPEAVALRRSGADLRQGAPPVAPVPRRRGAGDLGGDTLEPGVRGVYFRCAEAHRALCCGSDFSNARPPDRAPQDLGRASHVRRLSDVYGRERERKRR